MGRTTGGSELTMTADSDPQITVRFSTDANGVPEVVSRDGKRHYRVVFEIENAPADAYAATYELDPSYYDSVRTLKRDDDGKFQLKVGTFGDYPVIVHLHRPDAGDLTLKEGVARALKRARETMPANPEVDKALSYIADH
jgi:hypothetical protein